MKKMANLRDIAWILLLVTVGLFRLSDGALYSVCYNATFCDAGAGERCVTVGLISDTTQLSICLQERGTACSADTDCINSTCTSNYCAGCASDSDCAADTIYGQTCIKDAAATAGVCGNCTQDSQCTTTSQYCDSMPDPLPSGVGSLVGTNIPTLKCASRKGYLSPCQRDQECQFQKCDSVTRQCGGGSLSTNLKPDGTRCQQNSECQAGVCRGDAVVKVCGLKLPGEPGCTFDAECSNNVCNTTQGACAVLPGETPVGQATLKKDGQTCVTASECQSKTCSVQGTARLCGLPAGLAAGQRCQRTSQCGTGLYCQGRWFTKTCQTKLADGAKCRQNTDCTSGTCGGSKPKTCQPAAV